MNRWLTAATEAARDLATTSLGCDLAVDAEYQDGPLAGITGCFVALTGQEASVQVGLASDGSGCHALAQSLLGEEGDLAAEDVNDALGEIVNIMAGGVKKRMAEGFASLRLGLPLIVEGRLLPSDRQRLAHVPVRFGDVSARLVLVYDRE